jgi:hypothetical protein
MSDLINALIARGPGIDIGRAYAQRVDATRMLNQRDTALAQDQQRLDMAQARYDREQQMQDRWDKAVQDRDIQTMWQLDPQTTGYLIQHWDNERMSGLSVPGIYRQRMQEPSGPPIAGSAGGFKYLQDPTTGQVTHVQAPQQFAPQQPRAREQIVGRDGTVYTYDPTNPNGTLAPLAQGYGPREPFRVQEKSPNFITDPINGPLYWDAQGQTLRPAPIATEGPGAGQVDPAQALSEARRAIAAGLPRAEVIRRLRAAGIDPTGL